MGHRLNRLLDFLSEALAQRKGLLLVIAILLVAINYLLQFIPGAGWLVETNLFLHLGIVLGLIGVMIAWAL
jgi:uncharacterized membrane protein SirB2